MAGCEISAHHCNACMQPGCHTIATAAAAAGADGAAACSCICFPKHWQGGLAKELLADSLPTANLMQACVSSHACTGSNLHVRYVAC